MRSIHRPILHPSRYQQRRASDEELQAILKRRVSTSYSSKAEMNLNAYLAELEDSTVEFHVFRDKLSGFAALTIMEPNPNFRMKISKIS